MPADVAFLAEIKLFDQLDDDERVLLSQAVDHKKLGPNEVLFRVSEPGDALFIIIAGQIELFVKDTTGQKIILKVAERGDFFGELSLLDGGPRTATATSLGEGAELIVVDREDLRLLFQKKPDAALHMLAAMAGMTRQADAMLRTRVARNVNEEVEDKLTPLEKAADFISAFSGSMPFLIGNTVWFGGWLLLNSVPFGIPHFDPYPFGLLTMIVSLEAIFLSIFVLLSQNRQAAKDRVRSDIEYEVNIKAELEVAHLHEKTDQIHEDMLDRLNRMEKTLVKLVPKG